MRMLPLLFLASPAAAHTGHLGTMGGHDHWTLGVGIGVVVGAAVIAWVKGRKHESEAEDAEADEEAAEAEGEPA